MTHRIFLAASTLVLVLAMGAAAQQAEQQQAGQNVTRDVQQEVSIPLPSLSPLVERVNPAVVNVSVVLNEQQMADAEDNAPGSGRSPMEDFLRRFFEQQGIPGGPQGQTPRFRQRPGGRQGIALGSGFIIDPDGFVVTNNHVVGNADRVTVIFPDNSKHIAKIVGKDDKSDVALLKIDADRPLPFVTWGDSDTVKVGDWVVAVGNPFGLGGTVTAGIISALGRNIDEGPYDDFLQIDASINRGNSGGPTFNVKGQVIGINTAIYSPSGGSVGIGFAIPANLAKNVVDQLKQQGHVTRGWLGVQIQSLTPEIAKGLGLDPDKAKGALVADVQPNSPAAQAGVRSGDIIVRYNGKEVRDAHDLPRLVAETPVGRQADITVLRNGREQQLRTTIAELKEAPTQVSTSGTGRTVPRSNRTSALGLQLGPSQDGRQGKDGSGVAVLDVTPDSPAAGLVDPGDVIVSVNQQPVSDPQDAAQKLRQGEEKNQVLLVVNHRGANRFIGVPLDESQR
jgi:serine protease Do